MTFARIVACYGGAHRGRTLPCTEHFRIVAFAQLTYRESLRAIEACLSAQTAKLYHRGIRLPVKCAMLADANKRRDGRIYAAFVQRVIAQARTLDAREDLGLDWSNTVYALDSTTIDLGLARFPWAPFRRTKAAGKMHNPKIRLIDRTPKPSKYSDNAIRRWSGVAVSDLWGTV